MSEVKDSWWRPVALLLILIALSMDLLVWNFSGGIEFSSIFNQFALGFTLALGLTSFALLLVSIGSVHQYARWKEQIIGLILISGLGLSLYNWQIGGSLEEMQRGSVILLAGVSAMLAASGLIFGLLLALVTGREHTPDPLLEMESTRGDVPLELED